MAKTVPEWFQKYRDRMTWWEFNQNVYIDLIHKYVYVETAKVACSTIKARLHKRVTRGLPVPEEVHNHIPYSTPFVRPFQLSDQDIQDVLFGGEFFRFSFVREPVERVLSAYLDKIARPMPQRERFFERFFPNESPDYELTLLEFLDCLSTIIAHRNYDKHWRPQTELLLMPEFKYDFLGRFSSFEEDWTKVLERIGFEPDPEVEGKLNVVWHSTSAKERIAEYVTDEVRAKILELYAGDVELYTKLITQ